MPGTLAALGKLGIGFQAGDGQIFRRIRFIDGSIFAEAEFMGEGGIGLRRTVLHQRMVERAKERGVELSWKSPVTAILADGAIARGKMVDAKWIVGADGIYSRVRGWSGLEAGVYREVRFAQRRHYRGLQLRDCMELYRGRRAQAYVTPLAHDETCVVVISRDPSIDFEEALGEFPALRSSLRNGELSSVQRGAVTANCRLDQVYRGNVALAGDASGSVDAIYGRWSWPEFSPSLGACRCPGSRRIGTISSDSPTAGDAAAGHGATAPVAGSLHTASKTRFARPGEGSGFASTRADSAGKRSFSRVFS